MSIQFVPGQVAVGDPSPIGPSTLSGPAKDLQVKVVKLSGANYTTGGTNTLVAVLPADSSIINITQWVKTQLAGNGITAALLNIGTTSGGNEISSAVNTFGSAGAYSQISPLNNIVQAYQIPQGSDIQIWARGTATTGNPTSGEIYLIIQYVR